MSTPATSGTTRATGERRVARLFGLQGETWMRHANPLSGNDGAAGAFQTTVAGLLAGLPRIVGDLDRIDQAWTALRRELDQACPTP